MARSWQTQPRDIRGRFGSRADEGTWFEDRMRQYLPLPHYPRRYENRIEFWSAFDLFAREHWREPTPK